ncbi:hypothetical protein [Chitinophaga agrisoli]|nr:hypothetical protein [Chitinophaga agrisoli]
MSKSILLGLNELNFEYIVGYCKKGLLPTFNRLINTYGYVQTTSESEYKLLEPWIQWVTVHTGKTYNEHKVFRLGDIVEREDLVQIWEEMEKKGKKVGAVSPFNAANRLNIPSFFVPDPWTLTPPSGSWLIRKLALAVRQSVNDNAQERLQPASIAAILTSMATYIPFTRYAHYFNLATAKGKVGMKAIVLDSLLADVFMHQWKKHKPDFSSLFLNSGAHIQHHYLFNSAIYEGTLKNPEWYCPKEEDPLLAILTEYDKILNRLDAEGVKLYIATGLHQQPHHHTTFYWRLKEHAEFLGLIGIKYKSVVPRMSRDFMIEFDNNEDALAAEKILESYVSQGDEKEIFEVDNRGNSLFVELIYPNNIEDDFSIKSSIGAPTVNEFKKRIAFVAIKNGEHHGVGYFMTNFKHAYPTEMPLAQLHDILLESVN